VYKLIFLPDCNKLGKLNKGLVFRIIFKSIQMLLLLVTKQVI